MKQPKLKATGIFFSAIFLGAALINFFSRLMDGMPFFAALLDFREVLSVALIAALLLASAHLPLLAWLQPLLFLAITAIPFLEGKSGDSFFGLGFFAIGALLLFKLGFFDRRRVVKAALCVGYLSALEVFANLHHYNGYYYAFTPVLFIVAFLIFLYIAFRDRIFVYLKEPKPSLSLEAKGLSDAERIYALAIITGKTVKEVGFEHGISDSTVRNTLARAYRKLEVANRAGLIALAERYQIKN